MRWVLLLVVLAVSPTSAETIYRCKVRGGKVAIQNHPCEGGAPLSVRHLDSPPDTADAAVRLRAVQAEMDRRNAQARQPAYSLGAPRRAARFDACEDAKARRDEFFKRVGVRRTFDQLRWWDERVRKACP